MHLMQIQKASICGLSMGGYIALRAFIKYPERFSHLILCDTQCVGDTEEGKEKRYNTIRQIEADGLNGFAEGFIKNVFTAQTFQTNSGITENIKSTIIETDSKSVTGTLKALAEREETCSQLHLVKVPTLILCGKEDKITPPERSEFMHQNIAGSKLVIIENASHLSNLEQPKQFNEAIISFLSR